EDRRGVGQRPRARQVCAYLVEDADLLAGLASFAGAVDELVGACEVVEQPNLADDTLQRAQARMYLADILRRETQPVHAGIDLEPAAQRLALLNLLEHL